MVDSGGQYVHGTTDVTRTIPLGVLTDLEKEDYTIVLKGMIAHVNLIPINPVEGAQYRRPAQNIMMNLWLT